MTRKVHARNPAARDRAHGAGLPVGLSDEVYSRLQRKAHPVWELRPDDDPQGAGYQLVRNIEEPAVDLRRQASVTGLIPGARVAWVRKGEVAPAIVINVHQPAGTADLEFEDSGEEAFDVPLDMIMSALELGAPAEELVMIDVEPHGHAQAPAGDPFAPPISPSSKAAQYMMTIVHQQPNGELAAEVPASEAGLGDLARAAQLYGMKTIHANEPDALVAHSQDTRAGRYVLIVGSAKGPTLSDELREKALNALHIRGNQR